jgi:hypothetical protein
VANNFQAFFVFWRNDLQRRIALDEIGGINQTAIDLAGNGGLGQTGTDGSGNIRYGNGMIELADRPVREGNGWHDIHPSAVVAATSGHMT